MNEELRIPAEPRYEVVSPLGRLVSRPVDLAPPVADLNGKTLCELWDWLYRGDQIYGAINDELRKKFPGVNIITHEEMGSTHDDNERAYVAALPERLKELKVDAVISAVGA
jgi:hypothetical protein